VTETFAPGWPGIPARWTSSAKSGLGTAVSRDSRVWFTLSHGILNEVYYPRVDHACTRDLGFIVTDGQTLFSEEKRDARSETMPVAPGILAYRIRNTAVDGRYRIEKEVLTDPWRDVVLQRVHFVPLQGALADFRLYVLLAPHLANRGSGNTAWVGDYKGAPMLFAERDHHALALAATAPWLARSVGFVGVSDGWQDLQAHKRLSQIYTRAENGNVAVTGEMDLGSSDGTFVMALGFGPTAMEAGQHALISLLEDFDDTQAAYVKAWKAWHARLKGSVPPKSRSPLYRTSAAVLRAHESKRVEGGIIASLSIPWGFSKPDDDLGGYHLVWPRDLVETAGGFIAMGAHEHVRRVLRYLQVTQEPDGHWSQNIVARRYAVLARHSDGRNGTPHPPGGSRRSSRRHRPQLARRDVADGAASGGISRPQWSREPAGSLGRAARLFAFYDRDGNRCAAGRRRPGRRGIEQDGSRLSAGDGRRLECQHRTMAVLFGNGIGASARRRRVLRARRGA
jgi:glucoamylase